LIILKKARIIPSRNTPTFSLILAKKTAEIICKVVKLKSQEKGFLLSK